MPRVIKREPWAILPPDPRTPSQRHAQSTRSNPGLL